LLLTTLVEVITQYHYTDMFTATDERDSLDPTFMTIFKSHWVEESQHLKIDFMEVERCAAGVGPDQRETAIDELLEIGGAFDGLLKAQADLDVESLDRRAGRKLPDEVKDSMRAGQHRAYRYTFLVSGLGHPKFKELVGSLTKNGLAKIEGAAAALSA